MPNARIRAAFVALGLTAVPAAAQTPAPSAPSPGAAAAEEDDALVRPPSLSESDAAEFSRYEEAVRVYRAAHGSYDAAVEDVVRISYRRERERVQRTYNEQIEAARVRERARRGEAIASFEEFLQRFPQHPEITPDILFRLAELRYEASVDDYNVADASFQAAMERYDLGIEPDRPTEATKDFTPTIELFRRLIAQFPAYRQIDGAFYLLGVCYEEQESYAAARDQYAALVSQYPESMFAQEAYLRIGEYYFESEQFELARSAYTSSLGYGETKLYDKILFKLGWSNYLLSQYGAALDNFTALLDYYDEEARDGVAALRTEATQYFAISMAEEDWDLDGELDADFIMPRVTRYLPAEREWSGDVLDRLAAILMENTRFEYVVAVNSAAMARNTCDPRNIDRALLTIEATSQLRNYDQALELQRTLATRFGPGSEWYACQEREGNEEAMAKAEQVVKDNLIETAARYYLQAEELMLEAQDTGSEEQLAQAREGFAYAARIYADFLASYEGDPLVYEMQMYYAQSLLYSGQYTDAAVQFGSVRDSILSDEYMEVAAALAVQSYEYALEAEINAGRLDGRAWPAYEGPFAWEEPEEESDSTTPREPPQPVDVPELSLKWAAAINRYLELGLTSADDPAAPTKYAYQVAKLYYDYVHYPEARAGFERVLDVCNPAIDESGYAAGFLINSYRRAGDDVRELLDDFQTGQYRACVPPAMLAAILADVTRVSLGQRAERAERYFAEGKYEEAAEEYARIATEYRDDPEFAPLGVWNSGLIYEQQLQKYERAIAQFDRLIAEYPSSEYVDDAWVRIAVNAKRFFDFDRAIDAFLVLDRMEFSDPELVEFPILDAALLMESVGRRQEAAEAYRRFVQENPRDPRAPGALYSAGVLYDEMNDHRTMRTVFEQFRSSYGRATSTLVDVDGAVIDTYHRSAVAYGDDGDARNAERERDRILSEYASRLPAATAAKYAAAQVVYDRIMGRFAEWDSIRLGETVQAQQRGLTARRDGMEPLVMELRTVADYGSAEWTACSFYQEGRVFQVMADLLYRLPVPDFGGDYDAEDEYRLMVEDFASQYEDQAVAAWETAYPVMRELGVTNQCAVDVTAQLNRYRGAEYPVFRTAATYESVGVASPPGFQYPPDPDAAPAPPTFDLAAPSDDTEGEE